MPAVRPWALVAPLPAIALGAAVARIAGVPWSAYAPNVVGFALGVALFFVVARGRERLVAWLPVVAALEILATLAVPGLDGVHRWMTIGPLRLNISAALAPWLLLGLASGDRRALLAILVAQVAHVLQPDAAQATALAAAVVACGFRLPPRTAIPLALVTVALAAVAWLRPDPLAPVDHVERILVLAASHGPGLIVAASLTSLLALLPFRAHLPLLLYLVAAFAVTFLGAFPVPLLGAGAGPVLGWYALLAVRAKRSAPSPQ